MRVGLDFGTTNSSAAIVRDGKVHLLPLDPVNTTPAVLRSAVFIARDGQVFMGREAIDRYTSGNVGREVVYGKAQLGEIEMTFAEVGTIRQSIYARVDVNAPGRLFLSVKMALPDASYTTTNIFGTRWSIEELIALMLRTIKERIEAVTDDTVDEIVIGRPVHYAPDARGDATALKRMQDAAELAGLKSARFMPEPTAAALDFAAQSDTPEYVLVFDFGGGTLDLTVMRTSGKGSFEVLGTDGVPVGGDLLDRRIVMGKLLPHFGEGAELGPRRLPLPAFLLDHLDGWQSIVELHNPRTLDVMDEVIITSNRPKQLRALRSLVRENYGLPLYEMVERQKRGLSEQDSVTMGMDVADIQFSQMLERWDFERLIGPDVREVKSCMDRVLNAAGVRADQIGVVVRTGGSSRIPRFVRLLQESFPNARLLEQDVFTSVASGLALAAENGVDIP